MTSEIIVEEFEEINQSGRKQGSPRLSMLRDTLDGMDI